MSVNVNQMIGEAVIQACERAGFKLSIIGEAQWRVRDALCDPANNTPDEINRAASHSPRALPPGLSSDVNNKRGSVLIALRARAAKAAAADPLSAEAKAVIIDEIAKPGVINKPGFGDGIPGTASLNPEIDPLLQDTSL